MGIDLPQYVQQCAPHVAPSTMLAIIKTESRGNPLAIGLNRGYKLIYQPKSYTQAKAWVTYLEQHHYNFDVGLGQVNIKNIHQFGYSGVDALNPCLNLQMSSYILHKDYHKALYSSHTTHGALLKAISAYNTGNDSSGFYNGYVNRVIYNAVGLTPY